MTIQYMLIQYKIIQSTKQSLRAYLVRMIILDWIDDHYIILNCAEMCCI